MLVVSGITTEDANATCPLCGHVMRLRGVPQKRIYWLECGYYKCRVAVRPRIFDDLIHVYETLEADLAVLREDYKAKEGAM